jgi:hypothetical protein
MYHGNRISKHLVSGLVWGILREMFWRMAIAFLCVGRIALAQGNDSAKEPTSAKPDIINARFDELYPVFMVRNGTLPIGPKAARWAQQYQNRWIKWSGVLASISKYGMTVKMRPQTLSFDISVRMSPEARADLQKHNKTGDRITFIARLETYDDVFRTLYLGYGALAPTESGPMPESHDPSVDSKVETTR